MLFKGANVNAKTSFGDTPLHYLAEGASYGKEDLSEILLLLIHYGADVNIKSSTDCLPLHRAVTVNIYSKDKIQRKKQQDNALKFIKILINNGTGSFINTESNNFRTPLDFAITKFMDFGYRDSRVILILLLNGATINNPSKKQIEILKHFDFVKKI